MQYVIIIISIALTMFVVAMVVMYALSAAAYYSKQNADPEYKDSTGDALPFELGLAYGIWAMTVLALGFISDKFKLTPSSQIENILCTVGGVLLLGLSYFLVHVLCVKLSKKYPQLHEHKLMQ